MDPTAVSAHYNRANLLDAIEAGVHQLGKTTATVTIDELAPVDEFHIGGRQASVAFFDQLNFTADHHLLDVGCGLGGPARFVANHSGSRITGIDLTPEYVATGNALCRWVNVHEQVQLQTGNALSIPA
ncbi:MAG: methyltransferase domain-containing protein, partial [Caldilineaceae bacterium]|nr:methyltransferase domain-containing protein [Caldilineaceae bacterium]